MAAVAQGASTAGLVAASQSATFAGLLSQKLASGANSSSMPAGRQLTLPDGTVVDVNQVHASARQGLKQIQAQVTALLASNGLDAKTGIKLQVDATGQSHVVEPSANSSNIQNLLSAQPQLETLLSTVAQQIRILHAADASAGTGSGGQQAFAAALSGLSSSATTFTLAVNAQRTNVSFSPAE
jgi:hypothetical protein